MTKQCVIMIGIPRSGKSTIVSADYKDHQVICADDIRTSLGFVFDKRIEPIVHAICEIECRAKMERGSNIIIDETNVSQRIVKIWTDLADEYGYHKKALVVHTPFKECIKRNHGERAVPKEVIERMNKELNEFMKSKELQNLVDEIIFHKPTEIRRNTELKKYPLRRGCNNG